MTWSRTFLNAVWLNVVSALSAGHRLKNAGGNKTISALVALGVQRRVLLTGTPVQNNLTVRVACLPCFAQDWMCRSSSQWLTSSTRELLAALVSYAAAPKSLVDSVICGCGPSSPVFVRVQPVLASSRCACVLSPSCP